MIQYETQQEVNSMLESGMKQLTPDQLTEQLELLGYKVDKNLSFNYLNSSNERTYQARSIYLRHKGTGLGFANVDAPRDAAFNTLQWVRLNCFVFSQGRIQEL